MMKETVWFLLLACVMVGCSRDEAEVDATPYTDYLEIAKRQDSFPAGRAMKIREMASNDVIVAVNGYPLTKQEFDDRMCVEAQFLLKRAGSNEYMADEVLKQKQQEFVEQFVVRRLLLDEARRMAILPPTNVFQFARSFVRGVAKGKGKTLEKFLASYPGDAKYLYYDVVERVWIDNLVASNIPPVRVVDDAFVSNVQAQVSIENEKIRATNQLIRARLVEMKQLVLAKKASFGRLADQYSADADEYVGTNGYWCVVERGEMQDKKLQAAAFALRKGEISDPVEDDDGYHLIRMADLKPAEKNAKGRVIQREIATLEHIYLKKEPEIMRQDDKAMRKDLLQQMQMQAVQVYTENLKTNGQNRVEYPHGRDFF